MLSESLQRVADGLEAAIVEAREELARVQDQLSRLERIQQQLHDPYPGLMSQRPSQQKRGTSNGGESSNGQISDERAQRILAVLGEPSTARELAGLTGITQSTVSGTLSRMEKQGLVRKVGVRKQSTGMAPALWEPTP